MVVTRLLVVALLALAGGAGGSGRPAVLFCTWSGPDTPDSSAGLVDLAYLGKLHSEHGFEVDFTTDLTDVNATRLRQYNAIVVFCEGARVCAGGCAPGSCPYRPPPHFQQRY